MCFKQVSCTKDLQGTAKSQISHGQPRKFAWGHRVVQTLVGPGAPCTEPISTSHPFHTKRKPGLVPFQRIQEDKIQGVVSEMQD